MKPVYLEPNEEITSVIDKLTATGDGKVAIVVPKNSTLFQSLVNLKLLQKEAKKLNKEVILVANTKIGQRLAQQVGIQSYSNLGAAGKLSPEPEPAHQPTPPAPASKKELIIDGIKVNQYQPPNIGAAVTDDLAQEAPAEMPELPAAAVEEESHQLESPVEAVAPMIAETSEPTVEPAAEEPTEEKEKVEEALSEHTAPVEAEAAEPVAQPAEDLPAIITHSGPIKAAPREPIRIPWKSLIAVLIILLIGTILTYVFLPKATVKAILPAKPIEKTLSLTVKTTDDGSETTVPGNLLTSEKTVTNSFPATGKKDIGSKATGTITLYNKASSRPVTLAAGTTLTASSKAFTLDKATSVPGASVSGGSIVAGQSSATITASQAGDGYNLANAQFTISNQPSTVYGSGTTSGGVSKQVTILSQSDIDTAISAAKTQAMSDSLNDLKSKATGQTLLDAGAWQDVKTSSVDKEVNSQVDSANVSVTVDASALVFDQNQVENKMKQALGKDLPTDQELYVPDGQKTTIAFDSLNSDKTSMTVQASDKGYQVPKVNKTELIKSVKNKSKTAAGQILKDKYGALSSEITINPSWWPTSRLPLLAGEISFEYGLDGGTQ